MARNYRYFIEPSGNGDGYGQLELNQVAFRRDGRVEAQCALDPADFNEYPAENGMLLVIDKKNDLIHYPKDGDTNVVYGLNYSAEHLYDERNLGLKNFRLTPKDFYPRLGYLSVGDRYTTNAIAYDSEDFDDLDAIQQAISEDRVYAIPCEEGYHKLTDDPGDSPLVLEAVKYTTMPDGSPAVKFLVIKA